MDTFAYNININGLENLDSSVMTAAMGGVIGFALTVGLAIGILLIIAWWRMFEKAGEKGWKALIPIYNGYILFKICGLKNWFWVLLGVSLFAGVMCGINPPVFTSAEYINGELIITDLSADIEWSQHIPYLIGTIIGAAAGIATAIAIAVRLAKAFGKGAGFTLGLIFLSGIFYMILGFGKSKYDKKAVNA